MWCIIKMTNQINNQITDQMTNQITDQKNKIINYMHELKLPFDLIETNKPDIIYLRLPDRKLLILLYLSYQWAQTKQTIDLSLLDNAVNCPICQEPNGTWIDCPKCTHGYCLDCYINARIDGRGRASCLLCGVQLFDQDLTELQMRAWVDAILAQKQDAVNVYKDFN